MVTTNKQLKSNGDKYIPFSVKLEITNKCNLRCIHCCVDKAKKEEASGSDFKRFLNQATLLGSLELGIGGGEPLMRKDLLNIVEYARSLDFAVSIFTNATLIDSFTAKQLKALKVYLIYVSIYGSTAKIHDAVTGKKGSFDLLWRGVDYLLSAGLEPCLTTVAMKDNFNDLENIVKLVKHRVAKEPQISPLIFPTYKGDNLPLKQRISKKQLRRFYTAYNSNERFQDFSKFNKGISCKAAVSGCFIDAQGDVFACPLLRIKAGNIKNETFNQIWHSGPFERLRSLSVESFKQCKDCKLFSTCARCPGLSFLEYGDYALANPQVCIKTRTLYNNSNKKQVK